MTTKFSHLCTYKCPFDKVRYGSKNDGGYVVCETNVKYEALLSCGIGGDISFDNDFLKKHDVHAYGIDHTIGGIPKNQFASEKLQWIRKKVSKFNNDTETNLMEYIEKYNNIFLKMDIEGGEYDFFEVMQEDQLARISQIVIEIHDAHQEKNMDMFNILNKTHTILHAHGNNNQPLNETKYGYTIPCVLELTLVRNSDIENSVADYIKTMNNVPFPHNCDGINHVGRPELSINHWPFFIN